MFAMLRIITTDGSNLTTPWYGFAIYLLIFFFKNTNFCFLCLYEFYHVNVGERGGSSTCIDKRRIHALLCKVFLSFFILFYFMLLVKQFHFFCLLCFLDAPHGPHDQYAAQ